MFFQIVQFAAFLLGTFLDNYGYGSSGGAFSEILNRYPTALSMDKTGLYILGLLPGLWTLLYLPIFGLMKPQTIWASDATHQYATNLSWDILYGALCRCSYAYFCLIEFLPGAFVAAIVWAIVAHRMYKDGSSKSMSAWLDIGISQVLSYTVYAVCYLSSILFQLSNLASWSLLLLCYFVLIDFTKEDVYFTSCCIWIIVHIV